MARLYEHKKYGWQVNYTLYYPDGRERRVYRTSRKKGRAVDLLAEAEVLERKCIRGELSREDVTRAVRFGLISQADANLLYGRPVEVPTLEKLAETFLARSRPGCREKTNLVNKQRIDTLLEYFGTDRRADAITTDDVIAYRLHRLASPSRNYKDEKTAPLVSAATVNKEVIKLAQMLDLAVEAGAIPTNPARKLKPLKDTLGRLPRALSRAEIAALLEACDHFTDQVGGRLKEVLQIYLYTGMRREELLMQQWVDVNLERRTITIQASEDGQWTTKTRKARVIGIGQGLLPIIEGLPRSGRYMLGGDEPLCKPGSMSRLFRKVCDKAGLPSAITLHSLRHTYITHLIERGVNLRRVQYLAGHARISTTERYTHLLPTDDIAEDRLEF